MDRRGGHGSAPPGGRRAAVTIGIIASPSQGAGDFERDGYYATDDAADHEASA